MSTIAVVGVGAVGAVVAARLAQGKSHRVVAANRTPFDHLEVTADDGLVRAYPVQLTTPEEARHVDWVLVATKAYDVEATGIWLRQLVGASTRVAVLQNGVEHVDRFAPFLPRERIVPVVVQIPALRVGPGRVVQHGGAGLIVPDSASAAEFAGLFAQSGIEVTITDDFVTAAWRKLALNATGAITAATLVPRLDMTKAAARDLVELVLDEAITVGVAEGARLGTADLTEILADLDRAGSAQPNSMHADRLAGRPMEIDARNGAIVRIGRAHGIPTPVNALLADLLRAVEPA